MERRDEILKAALKVFAQQGYHKASIKQIAKAAGLKSTSHLYWYFEDKRALFSAVISELSPLARMPAFHPEMMETVMQQSPEEVLSMIAHAVLSIPDQPELQQVFRLYFSEAMRSPEVAEVVSDFQKPIFYFLKDYLERQIELGHLRPHDTQISARAWIASLIIHILATQVFTPMAEGLPDRDAYVRGVVDLFLRGLGYD